MKNKKISKLLVLLLLTAILASAFHLFTLPATKAQVADVVFDFSEVVKSTDDPRELAVAFHSVNFLDEYANSIEVLLFGTPEANEIQEEGWFENEDLSGIGSFQWTGGSSKKAVLRLSIPAETEGLLFNITSVADGIGMNVTIDGTLAAKLQVSSYWHSEYVPLGEAAPDPTVGEEPEWVEDHYFPTFPSTDRIYSIHVRSALEEWWGDRICSHPDWRINQSPDTMTALTLVGMQGLINRNEPRIYLDWEDRGNNYNVSRFWQNKLRQNIKVVNIGLEGLDAVNFLFQRYRSRFEGAVIYDPEVPDTINLATMIAGLENRVMLAPEQLGTLGIPTFDNVTDLRVLAEEKSWDASEEGKFNLYQWVYDNLWLNLEHRIIGLISPGPPTSRVIRGDQTNRNYFPLGISSRDYIIALRLSALWLSPVDEPQKSLFAKFMDDAPSPIPVFGFFADYEVGTVSLVSEHGNWVPVITNPNSPLSCGSLTALSGVRLGIKPYQSEIDVDHVFATLGDKNVLTIWSSDGDSIQVDMDVYYRATDTNPSVWEATGGWKDHLYSISTNPTLMDLAPVVWNYYTQNRSANCDLVCGISGVGYMQPALMNDTQLQAYLAYAAVYLNDSGLRTIWVDDYFGFFDGDIAGSYYDALGTGYLGTFVGGGSLGSWGLGYYYPGVPTPAVVPSYIVDDDGSNIEWIIQNLLSRKPGEIFIDLTAPLGTLPPIPSYPWHKGEVVEDADARDGKALLFSSDSSETEVIWGPFAEMAPGGYNLTVRLKVPNNTSNESIAKMSISYRTPPSYEGLTIVKQTYFAPDDFESGGKYYNFTIPFSLDRFAFGVEFVLDYYGGTNPPPGSWSSEDLYADYILATKQESVGLPVFAATGTYAWFEAWSVVLAQEFEQAGGLVLHPDEFMAVLNPEFMIEWATPILGSNHPAFTEARTQLEAGEYFSSLLTVREALRVLPENTFNFQFREKGKDYDVFVKGNTWITSLEYDENAHQIRFNSHGPLEGTVNALISIPNELGNDVNLVKIDNQSYPFTIQQNDTQTEINLEFAQGSHIVEVPIPALTPPSISILSPQNKTYAESDVPLTFTVNEPTFWIGYSLNGQANVSISGNTTLMDLSDGIYDIIVYANDTEENMGASTRLYFTVDTTPTPTPTPSPSPALNPTTSSTPAPTTSPTPTEPPAPTSTPTTAPSPSPSPSPTPPSNLFLPIEALVGIGAIITTTTLVAIVWVFLRKKK